MPDRHGARGVVAPNKKEKTMEAKKKPLEPKPYIVTEVNTGKVRLINASTKTAALAFVAKQSFTVNAAKSAETYKLAQAGVQIEKAA